MAAVDLDVWAIIDADDIPSITEAITRLKSTRYTGGIEEIPSVLVMQTMRWPAKFINNYEAGLKDPSASHLKSYVLAWCQILSRNWNQCYGTIPLSSKDTRAMGSQSENTPKYYRHMSIPESCWSCYLIYQGNIEPPSWML